MLKAGEGFKEWDRPRMTSYINVLLADEYRLSNDPEKANALYQTTCSEYTREKWWPLVEDIQDKIKATSSKAGDQPKPI